MCVLAAAALGLGATSVHLHTELEAARKFNASARCPLQDRVAASLPPSGSVPDASIVGQRPETAASSNVDSCVASATEIKRGNVRH